MRRAICPGSFDPVTHGHLDIVERATRLFDDVVVAVGRNTSKNAMFTTDERIEMLRETTADYDNVTVAALDGLLVDFCRERQVGAIVKGLRFASDFDYELQMAQLNKSLTGIETILLPTAAEWSFVSSTMIREIALLGGDISAFVPSSVWSKIRDHVRGTTGEP